MALLLHIDTALPTATVCITEDEKLLYMDRNDSQYDHAAWLHGAVASLLQKVGKPLKSVEAVSVSIGPGSYTGLRVGLSAAKGFCYALHKPLITIGTLEMIAYGCKSEAKDLICPMIDARRNEVFTALYNSDLSEVKSPHAEILNETSYVEILQTRSVLFCGNGSKKLNGLADNSNATFSKHDPSSFDLSQLAFRKFSQNHFADLAYTQPMYVKEFHSVVR